MLNKGDKVLDLGCGSGTKSKMLLENGLDVYGVDFSEKMIDIANKENPKGSFSVMDAREIDNIEIVFGGVLASAVLLHFPKKELPEMLEKIKKKIKENGYLYLSLKEKKESEKDEETVTEKWGEYLHKRFFSYYTMDEIKNILKDHEMEVVYEEILKTNQRNWLILIAKK